MAYVEEAERLEAYAARHPADGGRQPSPAPRGLAAVRVQLRGVGRRVARVGVNGFRRVLRWMPDSIRSSPATEPAKQAFDWLQRRASGQGSVPSHPRFVDDRPDVERSETLRRSASAAHGRSARRGLTGTATDKAQVAAIVVSRNDAHHLDHLLSSLAKHSTYPSLEVWIVDRGSIDDTRQVVARHQGAFELHPIWLSDDPNPSEAANQAARSTTAGLLWLLSSEVVLTDDVLGRMVDELGAPGVGVVGLTLYFPERHVEHPSGLQHAGIKFYADGGRPFIGTYNLSASQGVVAAGTEAVEVVPGVAAACALVRRDEFLAIGGLDPQLTCGFRDVDLALRYRRELGLSTVVLHDMSAIHHERAAPAESCPVVPASQQKLLSTHGRWLVQAYLRDKLETAQFFSDEPLVVGFAVPHLAAKSASDEWPVALGLAAGLEEAFGWRTVMLPANDGQWYDLRGVDVVVVLARSYDPRRIHYARPQLLKVAWVRDGFAEWADNPGFRHFDVVLSASAAGARYLYDRHRRAAAVVPNATLAARLGGGRRDPALVADVAFVGSRRRVGQRLDHDLRPETIRGAVALYGSGWSDHPRLSRWARGAVDEARLADLYASTRIIIDDSLAVVRPWGALERRVFDAMAAGALVVTNAAIGSEELFSGRLPAYDGPESLTETLNRYLDDEALRQQAVETLREDVGRRHTFADRARTVGDILRSFLETGVAGGRPRIEPGQLRRRVAIKIPVPSGVDPATWGDYHFGLAIQRCLHALGHAARVDLLPDWWTPAGVFDDIVIVLRGLSRFEPASHQATVMWNISHPEAVTDEEYESFDAVFVASVEHARQLDARLTTRVAPLLQCTDPDRFFPDPTGPRHDVLFVGNSRRQRRPVVIDAIDAGLPLSVYGRLWSDLIDSRYVRGDHVPNDQLRAYYSGAQVVLNDHWPEMRDLGFLSNRLFDVAACGTPLVTDPALGLSSVFGDGVRTYVTVDELGTIVREHLQNPGPWRDAARALAARIKREHTFAARTDVLMTAAEAALAAKR